jgi:hypothetical protein
MATSLAEQLREVVARRCVGTYMVPIHEVTLVTIADELERLQRENASLELLVKMRPAPEIIEDGALIERCEQLQRENDELRADADRYRTIRNASSDERNRIEHYMGPALDDVIDAARKEPK